MQRSKNTFKDRRNEEDDWIQRRDIAERHDRANVIAQNKTVLTTDSI